MSRLIQSMSSCRVPAVQARCARVGIRVCASTFSMKRAVPSSQPEFRELVTEM